MMINEKFWETEKKCSLFNRSGIKSQEELQALRQRVRGLIGWDGDSNDIAHSIYNYVCNLLQNCTAWFNTSIYQISEPVASPHKYEVTPENERIFKLDAERTFITEECREALCQNLRLVYERIGDYHQGEGFVIAFLSLFLDSSEVVELMTQFHANEMKGYFSCMPEAYVRDSRVLMKLLEERNEKLQAHLDGLLVPETFCSKWFIAMNVHVLTFEHVVTYIDRVLNRGQTYIFSFGLAFLLYHADEIIACSDVSRILQILRLDEAIMPPEAQRDEIYNGILNMADEIEVDEEKIAQFRAEVEKELKEQKESREKRMKELEYSDEEIVFSDEE